MRVPFYTLRRPGNGEEETWHHAFMVASGTGTGVVVLAPAEYEAPFMSACRGAGILVTPVPNASGRKRTRSTIMGRPLPARAVDIVSALENSGCPPQLVSFMKVGVVCDVLMIPVIKNPSGDYLERQGFKLPEDMHGQADPLLAVDNILSNWDGTECDGEGRPLPRPLADMDLK